MAVNNADPQLAAPASSTLGAMSWGKHLRRFFSFVGPTWLIAVTFVDPGGVTGALQQGSETRFALLWISWWSIVFGYVFQVLAARVALISGKSLGELCRERYADNALVRYTIWAFIEGSVFGDDIQACVGSTIALRIMTGLPWWAACLLTLVISTALTLAYYWDMTKLECAVGSMMLAMLVLVFVNVGYGQASVGKVLFGWVVPTVPSGQVLTVLGSVGGVLTPSALFLGSAMVLNRPVDRTHKRDVRRCLGYSFIELMLGMCVAFLIYLAITITFANGFYRPECAAQGLAWVPSEGQCDEIALGDGPDALASLYGAVAKWIFAIVLLLSGVNSMVSATLAGQATWEGLSGTRVAFWKLVLVTRSLVLVPTLVLALTTGNNDVTYTVINDWVNIFMSLAMPMAVIPVLDVAASKGLMKDLAISPTRIAVTVLLVGLLIGVNFYILAQFLFNSVNFGSDGEIPTAPTFYCGIGALWAIYAYLLCQVAAPGVGSIWSWIQATFGAPKAELDSSSVDKENSEAFL